MGRKQCNSTSTTFPSLTNTPYVEQFRRQSNEITAQALSVFDTSNQLAINAINAARENLKLYGKAIDAVMEFNNNIANAWSYFSHQHKDNNTSDNKVFHFIFQLTYILSNNF